MKKPYKIVSGASTPNSRELADWLAKDGQLLIPLVELLEKGERAIDEVIDVMGRATIEAVLQMSAAQQATDRNLAVGHVDVQLVADPGGLVALAVLLRADIAGGRQIVQHRRQVHGRLPFETCQDLWPFFALLRPPALALGRRGRLLLRGRLLTGLDGRRVAREVAHQPVVVRLPDQRFVHALGQLRVGELGKGAREDRLARHLELPLPAAEPAQGHIGGQPVQQCARRRQVVDRLGHEGPRQVAGPKEQGRRDADREVYWHGVQAGRVALKERQLQVDKPRLRKKRRRADEPGEVEIPAYTALQADQRLADRMLELVLRGVSTRKYETVLPAMADQVGVSKSEVSRETIEAGTRVLKELVERDLSELDVLVVYLDGIVFGDYHVLAAVGVDADGRKHVLGLCGGASENTEVTAGLLEDLVARGLRADRRRLFVIDGAKALRQAIGRVFGSSNLVQRCRNHKVRNVLGHLPKEQHEQARSTLRAAWKLDADEGIRKLEQYASWLEREWPSAAGSLREGLSELFTVNRLGLPKPLRRCLTTTNIIDSSHAGVRQHTNRVSRWQSEEMAVRWAAVTFRETEKHYRRITGYEHLWMLKAHLDEEDGVLAELQKAG